MVSTDVSSLLITLGCVAIGVGVLIKLGVPLGNLPGDLVYKKDGFSFYFPIVSCIVVSAILTLVFVILKNFRS